MFVITMDQNSALFCNPLPFHNNYTDETFIAMSCKN